MIITAAVFEHFEGRVTEHRGEFGADSVLNTQKTKQSEKQTNKILYNKREACWGPQPVYRDAS